MTLYLITGFLGAGKTTLMKNLIPLFCGCRMRVIVNEFGKQGVDGSLLAPLGAALEEIADGSLFCSCRIEEFEAALLKAVQDGVERVLVEASGLSDPGNIERILSRPCYAAIEYYGAICVIDAPRFEKILATVPVARKQLAVSRLVLVNKADQADEVRLRAIQEQVARIAPLAAAHATSYGRIDPAWLEEGAPAAAQGPRFQTKDVGLQKRFIRFAALPAAQLFAFVRMLAPNTHRLKGYVACEEGLHFVDAVGDDVQITLCPAGASPAEEGLCALAGPNLPLQSALAAALEVFRPFVAAVE